MCVLAVNDYGIKSVNASVYKIHNSPINIERTISVLFVTSLTPMAALLVMIGGVGDGSLTKECHQDFPQLQLKL